MAGTIINEILDTFLKDPIVNWMVTFFGRIWFLWLPVILWILFKDLWVRYVRAYFNFTKKYILLEIVIPRDVAKSPKAMESILAGIHGTNRGGNMKERLWDGWVTAWFSLEIVGDSSGVHFYIWTNAFFKRFLEAQIYAQYPTCEIKEVEDYVNQVPMPMPNKDWTLWGTEFILSMPDAFPIRTYEDFELMDISLKEEERKIDPLAPLLEFFGHLKGSEKFWIQILVRPAGDAWKKEGHKLIAKLIGKEVKSKPPLLSKAAGAVDTAIAGVLGIEQASSEKKQEPFSIFRLTPGEQEVVKAVEKNIAKIGFEVGLRWMYVAKRTDYNLIAVPAMLGVFKQFASPVLNSFKPNKKITTSIDYVLKTYRERTRRIRLFNAYRLRSIFHPPYNRKSKTFVLSSSELATIYHFPGMVAGAPGIARIEAKRGAPPPNLPI